MKRTLLLAAITILCALAVVSKSPGAWKDEEAIRKLVAEFAAAWNQNDAKAMAMTWTEDGDFIQPGGRVTRGRAEIEKRLAEEHAFFYKGSNFVSAIDNIRFLKRDVAVVDGSWEASGAHAPNGKPLPPLKGLFTLVFVKRKGQWRVASSRTMVPARAPGQ